MVQTQHYQFRCMQLGTGRLVNMDISISHSSGLDKTMLQDIVRGFKKVGLTEEVEEQCRGNARKEFAKQLTGIGDQYKMMRLL